MGGCCGKLLKPVLGDMSSASAYIVVHNQDGTESDPITPGIGGIADFSDTQNINYSSIDYVEIWQRPARNMHAMKIQENEYTIPLPRWFSSVVYIHTGLPQHATGKQLDKRQQDLKARRVEYDLVVKNDEIPLMLKKVPHVEQFSLKQIEHFGVQAAHIYAEMSHIPEEGRWKSLSKLKEIYKNKTNTCCSNTFLVPPPNNFDRYKSDVEFGRQRIAGTNNIWIRLCTRIPDSFGVTGEIVQPFLENFTTLEEALHAKRIFIVDHAILDGCPAQADHVTCAPIALFYLRDNKELVPIAIQLNQNKGKNQGNPVFLPSDPKYTWIIAKMWFNNADAAIHEAIAHLGYTHFEMEGMSAITHRNLSTSHPLFKLLEPHFLNIHAINSLALTSLVNTGGVVDRNANVGVEGFFKLIQRYKSNWRMNVEGTLPADLKARGVDSPNILPGYDFRDDAMLLYNAIKKYVDDYLSIYYTDASSIAEDYELQKWRKEMVATKEEDEGLGINGVPGDADGKFKTKDQISLALVCIIYTCSVGHAAVNFKQYDEYCFPPNYPLLLLGAPPTTKDELSEQDILDIIGDKKSTREVLGLMTILSNRSTQALGDFEVSYIHDPAATSVVKSFRNDLRKVGAEISISNIARKPPYTILNPAQIPNSISI